MLTRGRRGLVLVAALVMTVAAGVLAQAGLTGKWQGETRSGMAIVLDLTAKKDVLTGTITRDGKGNPLQEGKITKQRFTFKAVLGEQVEAFTGEQDGERIKVWLDRQGPEATVVLTRAAAK